MTTPYEVRLGDALAGGVTLGQRRPGQAAGKMPDTAVCRPVGQAVSLKPCTSFQSLVVAPDNEGDVRVDGEVLG